MRTKPWISSKCN